MSVKIRFSRVGRKNRPYWRIVAVDSRKRRDGGYLECLGTYDSINHTVIQLHSDRIQEWVLKGAECLPSVKKIIRVHKNVGKAPLQS